MTATWLRSRPSVSRRGSRHGVVVALAAVFAIAGLSVSPRPAAASWERTLLVGFLHNESVGDGHGRVTSDDGDIDCSYDGGSVSGTCMHHYVFGNFSTSYDVTLTFDPDPGNIACTAGGGGCAGAGGNAALPVHFDLGTGGDVTVTGSFTLGTYHVLVAHQGPGVITTNGVSPCTPSGGADACWSYKYGTTATLTAHPDTGYPFSYWLGSPCEVDFPHTATCSFTVTGDRDLTAVFGLVTLTIHHSTGGGPCEVGGDLCIDFKQSALRTYRMVGTLQTFAAIPEPGYAFDHWNTGPCAGKPQKCTFTLMAATDLTATFKRLVTASPPPKPTVRPSATPTARPSSLPTSAVTPAPGPTDGAAATDTPSQPPSVTPAGSGPLETDAAATGSPEAGASPSLTSAAPGEQAPVDAPTGGAGLDPLVLFLIGVVVLMTLVIGFLVGRLRAPTPGSRGAR